MSDRARRRLEIDGPRWAIIALLGFAGFTKVLALLLGVAVIPIANADSTVQTIVSVLAVTAGALEVTLAVCLALASRPRSSTLPWVVGLALSWILAMVLLPFFGLDVAHCGCVGAAIRLSLFDHVALTLGTLLVCASQARHLRVAPWGWYVVRGAGGHRAGDRDPRIRPECPECPECPGRGGEFEGRESGNSLTGRSVPGVHELP